MSNSGTLGTESPVESASFQEQAAHYQALVETMKDRAAEVRMGGGAEKIEREHERGKLGP